MRRYRNIRWIPLLPFRCHRHSVLFIIRMLLVIFSAAGSSVHVLAQSHVIEGIVTDAENGAPLPSASVRISGTTHGTISNSEGRFRIAVGHVPVRVMFSYIGYESDSIDAGGSPAPLHIVLRPNAVQLAAVTVTDEDPANGIIRRAIAEKQRWMSQLRTFEGKAFSRTQFRADDSIAAITESYSVLYWNRDDSLREVVRQRKQTGNLPAAWAASRVGEIINFNDDRIQLNGYQFTGPTAPDAFDRYEYRLLSTGSMDGHEVYEIEVIPRSSIVPLFRGRITIAERSFAVVGVDVAANEAFNQLFVRTRGSRYRQQFRLIGGKCWLPFSYRFDGRFEISIAGFTFPSFAVERDVVIYEYRLNPLFADSVLVLNRITIDSSSAEIDSAFWRDHNVLPLSAEQDAAYRSLDSTQTLEKRLAPKGAAASLTGLADGILGYPDVWFNRVEGFYLGVSRSFRDVIEDVDLRAGAGAGTADRRWKWFAGTTLHFGNRLPPSVSSGLGSSRLFRRQYSISLDLYDRLVYFPEPLLPGLFLNSFSALLLKDDVQDYYRAAGATVALRQALNDLTRISVSVTDERQLSVVQHTNYSWIFPDTLYAPQPGIADGRSQSVTLSVTHHSDGLFVLSKQGYLMSASAEHAFTGTGGVFRYTQMKGKVRARFATMFGEESLYPPVLGLQLSGGTSFGSLPPQRYFELYARFETAAGYGTLRALPRRQFYGDRFIALTADHNFRRVLFAPFGIRRLMESNLELIVEANAARSWLTPAAMRIPAFPAGDSNGWYYEASIGMSNIFDLLRFDVTRRFSAPGDWAFSLTASDVLVGLLSQQ